MGSANSAFRCARLRTDACPSWLPWVNESYQKTAPRRQGRGAVSDSKNRSVFRAMPTAAAAGRVLLRFSFAVGFRSLGSVVQRRRELRRGTGAPIARFRIDEHLLQLRVDRCRVHYYPRSDGWLDRLPLDGRPNRYTDDDPLGGDPASASAPGVGAALSTSAVHLPEDRR